MKKDLKKKNNLVIYQAKSGAIELRGDFERETIWATQAQIAEIFDIDRSVATKHIRNIIKGGELDEEIVTMGTGVKVYNLCEYFSEPFFETKKLVYVPG